MRFTHSLPKSVLGLDLIGIVEKAAREANFSTRNERLQYEAKAEGAVYKTRVDIIGRLFRWCYVYFKEDQVYSEIEFFDGFIA